MMVRVNSPGVAGSHWSVCLQKVADGAGHVGRAHKGRGVRIDPAGQGGGSGGGVQQLRVGILLSGGGPGAAAAFEQPHPGNILQQPDGVSDAAFIGEVEAPRLVRDDGRGDFRAQQRPGSRTQECSRPAGLYRGHSRSGIVTGRARSRW